LGKGGTKQCTSTRWVRVALFAFVLSLAALMLVVPTAGAITPQQLANQAMRIDPRRPSDINLFTSKFVNGANGLYPQGGAMQPSSAPDLTTAQARTRLQSYLQKQFPNDPAKVNSALALFDSQNTSQVVPDPTLRAAFVGMRGTLLQPTIGHFLNSNSFMPTIKYGPIPQQDFIAVTAGQSGQRQIIFNDRYSREDFRQLIGTMGHEIQHDDTSISRAEEVILNALSGMTDLKVLVKNPGVAYSGTELARQVNTQAMLFLNSRENDSPNSEIYAPTGVGVAPGSPFNTHDFWTIYGGDSQTSPAPSVYGQIATSLGLPSASNFSLATAKTFQNLNDSWVSDVGRAQISVLLKLRSVTEISNRSGLSRSQVISKLGLQPYLDAQN
jgi:hypothetical protein